MVYFSAKKGVPVAAAVGAIGLVMSGTTASPVHSLMKRIEVAVWGANIGQLAAAVKDFLKDTDAFVSTQPRCLRTYNHVMWHLMVSLCGNAADAMI